MKMQKNQDQMGWPVILNKSLQNTEYALLLRKNKMKIRVSDTTIHNTAIFPKSGVAFLAFPLDAAVHPTSNKENRIFKEGTLELIDKFVQVHRNCFLLACAPTNKELGMAIFTDIQYRYLGTNLQLIPIQNTADGVNSMTTIAKLHCKPFSDVLNKRLKCLGTTESNDSVAINALKVIGLTDHEITVVLDGIGSLQGLAKATREDLLDCSLDSKTVDKILSFFQ